MGKKILSNFASGNAMAVDFRFRTVLIFRNEDIMTKEQKLLKRWTLDLANQLIDEGRTRKAAFKQAHLTRRLMECLGMGTVVFEYEKKDGTVRRARGTLCKGISKDFDHYEYKTEQHKARPFDVFTYYDLDAPGFRTFSAIKLVRIIETVIKSKSL